MKSEHGYNPIEETDETLIKACLGGNRMAFDELVIRYKDRVFNLCFRFLGSYQDAEDISQDVFVKVYRSLKGFRFRSSFSTWLYRIAINACKNRVKSIDNRQMKNRVYGEAAEKAVEDHQSREKMDAIEDPLAELERKERIDFIMKAIDSLPSGQKTLIILRDIEGLSYEEIVDITGMKPGTLKSRLSRARTDLRERLEGNI